VSRFLGITREPVFSPGRVDDDGAILRLVAERLQQLGQHVSVIAGDADRWPPVSPDTTVFTMCQGAYALERLQQWAARGIRIVNRPDAILNCQRHRTVAAFANGTVPFPASLLLSTDSEPKLPTWVAEGAWLKRGDVHATEPDDVVFVSSAVATHRTLHRFRTRGIARVVLQRHAPGTVFKFYGVHKRFFHGVVPAAANPVADEVVRRIETLGAEAAAVLNLEVYGGDCVVGVNDTVALIDLNDWPSYAPCRAEAAKEIAAYLLAQSVASDT